MMGKPKSTPIKGTDYFIEDVPIYINRSKENFKMSFHSHDFCEIAYVAEGKGFHHIEQQTFPVSKGDLFVLPVGVSHVFRPSSTKQRGLIVYNCVFQEKWLYRLPPELILPDMLALFRPESGSKMWISMHDAYGQFETTFREMHYEYSARSSAMLPMLTACFIQLLIKITRLHHSEDILSRAQPHQNPLDAVISYIHAHLGERLNLSDLAQRSGISERHLHRLFKTHTGQSFTHYIQNLRIERAQQSLRSTAKKIQQIAEDVGYRDVDSFYRVFKQIVGQTPGHYRKYRNAGFKGQEKL